MKYRPPAETRLAGITVRNDTGVQEGGEISIHYDPMIAKLVTHAPSRAAAIEALKAHPVVNAFVDMDAKTITYHDAEHLGIAVDTDRGLLVHVIHDADDPNPGGHARKTAERAAPTRDNKVRPDHLAGGRGAPQAGGGAMGKGRQDYVKATGALYKEPRAVEFREALPRTETGKLQRFRLRG